MKYEVIDVSVNGSVGKATLSTYIISHSESIKIEKRPMTIICPGGGYNHVSEREGEMLALSFLAMGYHAAVLHYSVAPATYPTQLLELAKAMCYVRRHMDEWHIDEEKIFVQGSSAGGHLAASLGCFWKRPLFHELTGGNSELVRPNGMILSYPVITSGEFAHRGSFQMVLADRYEELVDEMSLEKQVNSDTPKTFLWHTFEDGTVPVENTLLFAQALREKEIPFECHIYPKGRHGLALGNELTSSDGEKEIQPEVTNWIQMAGTFIKNC